MVCRLGGGNTRLIYAGSYLIAQSQITTMLLQVETANTVIAGRADEYAESQSYSPYGFSPIRDQAPIVQFNGEWRDPKTGNYPLGQGYRLLSPIVGRFFSPDQWSPFGRGGLNAYAYCAGDPVNFHDPSGHTKKGFNTWRDIPPKRISLASAVKSADLPPTLEPLIQHMIERDPDGGHVFWRPAERGRGRQYRIGRYSSASHHEEGSETYFNFDQKVYQIERHGTPYGSKPSFDPLFKLGDLYAAWSKEVGAKSYLDAGFQWLGPVSKPLEILLDSPRSRVNAPNVRNRLSRPEQHNVSDIRNPSEGKLKYE